MESLTLVAARTTILTKYELERNSLELWTDFRKRYLQGTATDNASISRSAATCHLRTELQAVVPNKQSLSDMKYLR